MPDNPFARQIAALSSFPKPTVFDRVARHFQAIAQVQAKLTAQAAATAAAAATARVANPDNWPSEWPQHWDTTLARSGLLTPAELVAADQSAEALARQEPENLEVLRLFQFVQAVRFKHGIGSPQAHTAELLAKRLNLEVRTSAAEEPTEKRDTKPTGKMWLQRLEASHRRDLLEVHGDISQKELDGMMAELFSLSAEEIRTRLLEIAEPRQVPPTVRTIQRAVKKTEPWMHYRDTSERPDRLTRQEGGRNQAEIDADEWLRAAGENPNRVSFTPKK